MANSFINELLPVAIHARLQNADGTAFKTAVNADPTSGRLFNTALCANADTIAHVVNVAHKTGATNSIIASVSVPAGSGYGGVAPVNLFAALNATQAGAISLDGQQTLEWQVEVAMVGTFNLDVMFLGARI